MQTAVEQRQKLVSEFPPGCKIRVIAEDVPGRVVGYCTGGLKSRGDELALRVRVPADLWVLYSDQVERVKEANV